jgi:hypothetical protein
MVGVPEPKLRVMSAWWLVDAVNGDDMVIADRRQRQRELMTIIGDKPSLFHYVLALEAMERGRQLSVTDCHLVRFMIVRVRRMFTTADDMEEAIYAMERRR